MITSIKTEKIAAKSKELSVVHREERTEKNTKDVFDKSLNLT